MDNSDQEDAAAAVLAGLGKARTNKTGPAVATTVTSSSSSVSDPRGDAINNSSQPIAEDEKAHQPSSATKEDGQTKDIDKSLSSSSCLWAKMLCSDSSTGSSSCCTSFPVEPRVVQFVKISKSRQDHSYRDFSIVPPPVNYEPLSSKTIDNMSFAERLHAILADPQHHSTIRWMNHGRAFHVDVPKNMEKHGILMQYFRHDRYSSFLRQLNNHGFKHLTVGPDRNSYYHECFLRGLPHLCAYLPPKKDARRLIPDPDNEPNFYAISKAYPLPGDTPQDAKQTSAMPGSNNPRTPPASPGQANTVDSFLSPPLTVRSAPTLPAIDRVTPFAAILQQTSGGGEIVVPHSAVVAAAHHQRAATFLQQQASGSNTFPSPDVVANALGQPQQGGQGITHTSFIANSVTQDTLNFSNDRNSAGNNSNSSVEETFGNTITLDMLGALLVRQSQVSTSSTHKHALGESDLSLVGSHSKPTKVARFDPLSLLQVPLNIATPSWPTNDIASANRRIQDVAFSLASMEKFRSEALRLETERKKTEELQKVATANALAAQAALLEAIFNGQTGGGVSYR